ncbi:MAG: DUF5606 domain-containing protein [Chitinophagales bacterium]
MEFKDVVAVSGMGGLFEMISQRPDGMLIQPIGSNKKKFVSNRIHTFSPLDKIGIYTLDGDSLPLEDVMRNIHKDVAAGGIIPKASAKSTELKAFFNRVMEDYDDERVYVSDIKKVIKWYAILAEHDLITEPVEAKAEIEESNESEGDSENAEGEVEKTAVDTK